MDHHVGMPRQIYQDDHIHYDQRVEHRRRSYPKEESLGHREFREEYDLYYQSRVAEDKPSIQFLINKKKVISKTFRTK